MKKVYFNAFLLSCLVLVVTEVINVQFSLPEDATVSLCVATPDGSMIDRQIGGQRMEQGDHSRRIGVRKPGVYVVSYVVNGRIYNKKVSVK